MLAMKCLRDCHVGLDIDSRSLLDHQGCNDIHCASGSLRNLTDHISLYIRALESILVNANNIKDRFARLSVLYSLYIQSYVRHGLYAIEGDLHSH
jgi:hypothetical protein